MTKIIRMKTLWKHAATDMSLRAYAHHLITTEHPEAGIAKNWFANKR